jgi:uncharacterized membrane protein YhhN
LVSIPFGLAVADWLAVYNHWRRAKYITKPGVMVALLAWLWLYSGFQGPLLWFALGIVFSLVGDVFLLFPPRFFSLGLVSFLLAHLAYIWGLNAQEEIPVLAALLFVLVTFAAGAFFLVRLDRKLRQPRLSFLRIPVWVYSITISLMMASAALAIFRPSWDLQNALLVAAGGMLFFISDNLLAWNCFVSSIRRGKFWVRITYHMGQLALILGAALHYKVN